MIFNITFVFINTYLLIRFFHVTDAWKKISLTFCITMFTFILLSTRKQKLNAIPFLSQQLKHLTWCHFCKLLTPEVLPNSGFCQAHFQPGASPSIFVYSHFFPKIEFFLFTKSVNLDLQIIGEYIFDTLFDFKRYVVHCWWTSFSPWVLWFGDKEPTTPSPKLMYKCW